LDTVQQRVLVEQLRVETQMRGAGLRVATRLGLLGVPQPGFVVAICFLPASLRYLGHEETTSRPIEVGVHVNLGRLACPLAGREVLESLADQIRGLKVVLDEQRVLRIKWSRVYLAAVTVPEVLAAYLAAVDVGFRLQEALAGKTQWDPPPGCQNSMGKGRY
jgi:hypothetical protein